MALKINSERAGGSIPASLLHVLPYRLSDEIRRVAPSGHIEEIRLRCERCASITVRKKNIVLSSILTREEMDAFLSLICNNSLYAHRETINSGYVTLEGGIRVGICGSATVDGGVLLGIHNVSSMNIRIPTVVRRLGEPICRLLRSQIEAGEGRGVLVFAPPGEGKTTVVAAVSAKMASGENPIRVCVIDTRGELAYPLKDKGLCLDMLSGYPRGLGIEIATRTMNAELIVCDEIGDEGEAKAIISAQNTGVPFLATAHARDISGLLQRTPIRLLHEAGVFAHYVALKRNDFGEMSYTVLDSSEAYGCL
ncbi:MAG: hypothetical protein IKB02_07515 [Clostridia bacterium]|nr:hypothetical protein [Clostridia bacterium]